MKHLSVKTIGLSLLVSASAMVMAHPAQAQEMQPAAAQNAPLDPQFARFAPKQDTIDTKIDYSIWDEALRYTVLRMGRSLRESASRPEAGIGTRLVYGHDSRYRLEGNRVVFEYMSEDIIASLTEYRQDLERTADLVDIQALSKNEQLAYWINLHNVAVIEQIALAYPVRSPSMIKLNGADVPLDETPFITVSGVKLSPKDIRTKIVYPNWSNPKILYGFFRGDIGGPSIQRDAYTANNVSDLLDASAREFVNSLRGTQKSGSTLDVSKIYEEARPYLFPAWPTDLREHLLPYAEDDLKKMLAETSDVRANVYESDIADLAKGERTPYYGYVVSDGTAQEFGMPEAIRRLLAERNNKFEKMLKDGERTGIVTVITVDLSGEGGEPAQVE